MTKKILAVVLVLVLLALVLAGCTLKQRRAFVPAIQYTHAIDWQAYETGVSRAKVERKPVLLVLGADWCVPCRTFAHVFEDPRVVAAAKDFVLVHVNVDQREDLSTKYRRGGAQLPRTYFLTADGALLTAAYPPNLCQRYTYDLRDPASLLGGMERALKLARDPATRPDEDPGLEPYRAAAAADACKPKATDEACGACLRSQCCAEATACVTDARYCLCSNPTRGEANDALDVCAKRHCPQCPVKKPATDGAPP